MLKTAVIVSFLLHALGVMFLFFFRGPYIKPPLEHVITTQLVRLGEDRPDHLLPRKETPPPPTPVAETPPAEPVKTVEQPVLKIPTAKERLQALSKVAKTLERLKHEPVEGDAQGVPSGELKDPKKQQLGDRFVSEVYQCLKEHYAVLGLNPAQVLNRRAQVIIYVQADGRFKQHALVSSSGLPAFDRAVIRAVEDCGHVSAPPKEIREDVRREGLLIDFTP